MKGRGITVALGVCLLAAALLVRFLLVPGNRDTQDAANHLLTASQQAMAQASRLDATLAMRGEEQAKSFDALLSRGASPEVQDALTRLRECTSTHCADAEALALATKTALAGPLSEHRKLLAGRQKAGARNEYILLALLGVSMLLAVYLALFGYSEAREASAPASAEEGEAAGASADNTALEEEYRKRLEQLYEVRKQGRENARFAAYGEIAAGLSHGLKTPLACVRAATQVAQAKIDDAHPAQENLDSVIDEVDDLVSQINRFLKTMGGGAPVLKRLKPKSLLQPLDKRYRQGLADKKVSWRLSIAEDAQDIFGEPELIEMALRNLIDNAMEATRSDSEVVLRVQRCPAPSRVGIDATPPSEEDSSKDWIEFAVLDRGPGVALDVTIREKIESTREGGSGLGISIARRIAGRLGGTLLLSAREDGEGTRASFILPPCEDEAPEAASA